MEPRIATLLDQSPYKRLTLDPSVLTASASAAPRYIEPAAGLDDARSNRDPGGHHDQAETRNKTSLHAPSSAPIARVLNNPSYSPQAFQPIAGRQTPQHAAFQIRSDGTDSGSTTSSSDVRRRDEHQSSAGYPGGDNALIQLPKPPQVPRKTTKRPRIPPLLQGLHQPPPLPPKSRLFPPITSDRSGLVSDVGDRFSLGGVYPTSSTEELAKARASSEKKKEIESDSVGQDTLEDSSSKKVQELAPGVEHAADQVSETQPSSRAQNQVKAPRKRTRWSQKETEDLLTGVSRFGIGRWKQILDCPDLHFQGRTAVDLKDRFRVCRPGEGLKARKATAPRNTEILTAEEPQANSEPEIRVSMEEAVNGTAATVQQKALEGTSLPDYLDQAVTRKVDIHGPFLKSKRRARREFSDTDDKNLLKGFQRHGPVWHSMRDDFELGFGMRHPTDLRDRFRIRYPELFAQAGYKLKPKEERELKAKANETKAQEAQASRHSTGNAGKTPDDSEKSIVSVIVTTTPKAPSVSTLLPSQSDSVRPTFDLTDLTFDDDDGERSPIVLNRNILQWADENSSFLPTTTMQTTNHTSTDLLYNPFTSTDGLHINPLATLKLPSTAHWTYTNAATASSAPPSLPRPGPLKHSLPTNTASTSANTSTSTNTSTNTSTSASASTPTPASVSRAQQEMRTPNLPNIVFPYVPSASARNAVLNLPAPADILSSGQGSGAGAGGSEGYIWIG